MKRKCFVCKEDFKTREVKRLKGNWICEFCYCKQRKEHREYLKREVVGIRKRADILREAAEKRKKRENSIMYFEKPRVRLPALKSIKPTISLARGIGFTMEEKDFLYKKYIHPPYNLDPIYATAKVKKDVVFLTDLIHSMRKQKKSEEEINKTFKEEFAKLVKTE